MNRKGGVVISAEQLLSLLQIEGTLTGVEYHPRRDCIVLFFKGINIKLEGSLIGLYETPENADSPYVAKLTRRGTAKNDY